MFSNLVQFFSVSHSSNSIPRENGFKVICILKEGKLLYIFDSFFIAKCNLSIQQKNSIASNFKMKLKLWVFCAMATSQHKERESKTSIKVLCAFNDLLLIRGEKQCQWHFPRLLYTHQELRVTISKA